MKKKLVIFHQYFNTPDMPGSSRIYNLANFLSRSFDVTVVTSDKLRRKNIKSLYIEEVVNDFKVVWIKGSYDHKFSFVNRIRSFISFVFRGYLVLRRMDFDLFYASSTPLTIAIPPMILRLFKKFYFIFEVRDQWPEVPIAMGYIKNPLLKKTLLYFEKIVYLRSDLIFALSDGMKIGIEEVIGPKLKKIIVAPNCSDPDYFHVPEQESSRFKIKMGFSKDDFLVAYIGAFGYVNEVTYLVHLADKMKGNKKIKFILIGDGVEKEKILQLKKKFNLQNLMIKGKIPKKEIPLYFSIADVSCSTVRNIKILEDNSANKFFDSLASGRIIAINHEGWQKDLIENHQCGVYLSRNLELACNKIKQLSDLDNYKIDQMKKNSLKLSYKFSTTKIFSKIEKNLLDLIK